MRIIVILMVTLLFSANGYAEDSGSFVTGGLFNGRLILLKIEKIQEENKMYVMGAFQAMASSGRLDPNKTRGLHGDQYYEAIKKRYENDPTIVHKPIVEILCEEFCF